MRGRVTALLTLLLAPWLVGFSPLRWVDPAAGANRAGNDQYQAGRFEDAAKSYSQGVAADPGRAELLYNLGNALERLGKHDEAGASYHQALEKVPESLAPDAWYNLGNSLLAAGQGQAAVQAYREALLRNPGHAGAKRNLELALEQAKHEPPKSKQGQNGRDDQKNKSSGDQQKSQQQDRQTAKNDQQQSKPSDSEGPRNEPSGSKDDQRSPTPGQGSMDHEPEDSAASHQQPPPASEQRGASAKPEGDERDLTRDQAEGLLRSFEQMERRQLQEAHPPKEPGVGIGGRDW